MHRPAEPRAADALDARRVGPALLVARRVPGDRRRAAPSLWSLLGRLRHLRWPCGAMCMSTVRRNLTGSALPVRCHHQSFLAVSPPRRGGSEPTAPPLIDCRRRLPMAQALPALPGCSGGGGGGLIGARVRLRLDRPLRLGPLTPLVAWERHGAPSLGEGGHLVGRAGADSVMEGQELRVAGAGQEAQRHRKALGPRPGWGPAGWRGGGVPPTPRSGSEPSFSMTPLPCSSQAGVRGDGSCRRHAGS